MNCWKSININRDYGLQRIMILSILIGLFYFVIFYVSLSLLFPQVHYQGIGLTYLILSLLLVFPIHKLLHCLPVWLMGKKAYLKFQFENYMFPMIYCKFPKVLSKNVSLVATITPTIFITAIAIIGSIIFPVFIPFFSIFSTLNITLGIIDFIYVIHLWNAPRSAFLEDNHYGFHILTKEVS